jgi:TonB family protein
MGSTTGTRELFAATANDRLHRRWHLWVRKAAIASFLAHGLLFAVSPQWRRIVQDEVDRFRGATLLVTIPTFESTPDPGGNTAPSPAVAEAEGETEVLEGGTEGSGMGIDDLLDIYRDMLPSTPFALAAPITVVEEVCEGSDCSRRRMDSPELEAVTADRLAQLRATQLNLEHLAALRPELALSVAYPDWPLLRNPATVVRYIVGEYQEVRGASPVGSVSVAMWVDERGAVGWSEVYESSGVSALDNIALSVFRDVVEFRPARRQGTAVPMSVVIWIHFPF